MKDHDHSERFAYAPPTLSRLPVRETLSGTFESAQEGVYVGTSGGTDFFGNASDS